MFEKDLVAVFNGQTGNSYTLNKDDVLGRTFTAKASNSNDISLGYVGANSFDLSISNLDGRFDTAIFKKGRLSLSVKEGDLEHLIGKFNVETAEKTSGAINLSSTDAMVKFDVKFMGGTFPMTIGYLVNLICTQLEIGLATLEFTNSTFIIKDGEDLVGKTCREILLYCCELCGLFTNINLKGQLELKWYDFTKIVHAFEYNDFKAFTCDESSLQITGVLYDAGETRYLAGNDGNPFVIRGDHPFLKDASEIEIQGLLDRLYEEKIDTLGYLPCTFSTPNYTNLSPGDVIKVQDKQGQWSVALVTELKITDMLELQVKSVGKSLVDKSMKSASSGNSGDKGDKIGFVAGRNEKAYTTISSSGQALCLAAFTAEPDTKFYVAISIRYTLTVDSNIKMEYRVNGTPNEVFFQYGHAGDNTFAANFIPFAVKAGTTTLDVKLYTSGSAIASVEKYKASINLLVKNGVVVETPPYPEITLSQTLNPVTIQENDAILIARLSEGLITETQTPTPGIFVESFTGAILEENEVIQIGLFNDVILLDRVIGGEILRFNQSQKDRYNYSTTLIKVSETDFREQDTYVFIGSEKPIDAGLLIEVSVNTDGFKNIHHLEVEVS